MKLLFICPYFYPRVGGLETYVYHIAKGLQQTYGYECVVLTTSQDKQYHVEQKNQLTIYRLPILFTISNTPFHPLWFFQIRKILKKENPDIINAHAPVPGITDVAFFLKKDIPFILTYHAGSMKKGSLLVDALIHMYEHILLKTLFETSTAIVSYYDTFIRSVTNRHAPIHTISPGVDTSMFYPSTKKKNSSILYVGKIDSSARWKGIEVLIKAFAQLHQEFPNYTLDIVGMGNDIPYYQRMATRLQIASKVRFYGEKRGKDLRAMYQQAKIVVLPSITDAETFGMVLIEAMACKTAVVASRIGGIPNVFEDKKEGFLFTPGDESELAERLRILLTHDSAYTNIVTQAYKKVIKEYTWEKQIAAYNNLFSNYER